MKLPNLSQLESESLMRDQMKTVKGGDGDGASPEFDRCASCFCPIDQISIYFQVYGAALQYVPMPEPE